MRTRFESKFTRHLRSSVRLAPAGEDTNKEPREATVRVEAPPTKSGRRLSFPVDLVTPAAKPIWCEPLASSLAERFQRKILVLPDGNAPVVNAGVDWFVANNQVIIGQRPLSRVHPLIDAAHIAFSQHRPLLLSPDAIWLTIAQGFGHHVLENAEQLRSRLVRHKGKRKLTVSVDELTPAAFEGAIDQFSILIQKETDPVLHETLICDFSTTSRMIRTASEVALMDTYSSYFTYALMCVCGIPSIAIDGTAEDWRRIRARLEVLATYELEWWACRLRPILDEFILAAEGNPTLEFWQAIYKPKKAYAAEVVTGWLADLFPYLGDAPKRMRNPVLENERRNWSLRVEDGLKTSGFSIPANEGVATKRFPSGLSSAPLKVTFRDATCAEVDLVAGFLGVQQDDSDHALSPLIGWCVAEPVPRKPVTVMP